MLFFKNRANLYQFKVAEQAISAIFSTQKINRDKGIVYREKLRFRLFLGYLGDNLLLRLRF